MVDAPSSDASVKVEAYRVMLAGLSEDDFVAETKNQIWLSGFASNNPRAPAHWKADAAYDEAERRQRPWLYQRGWNRAYRLAGYEPSESDLKRATAPAKSEDGAPPQAERLEPTEPHSPSPSVFP